MDEDFDSTKRKMTTAVLITTRAAPETNSFQPFHEEKAQSRATNVLELLASPSPNKPGEGQLQRSKVNTATREATEALLSTTGITSSSEAAQLLIALSERTSWLLGNDATAEIQRHEINERIVQSLANMYDKIIKTNKHGKKGGTQSLDYTNDFLAFQRDDVSKRTNRFKIMPYGIARVVQGPQMVDSSPGTTNLKDYKGHEFKAGEWFIKK